MPDIVITNILDRLPLQEAVRTGILSRNWRYKWTILSQLVFDDQFFEHLIDTEHEKDYERIISRLLLNLKGVISKFVLYMEVYPLNEEDIAHWFLFRKGVKDLTICMNGGELFDLPTHIFSCSELKHLNLHQCRVNPPASFHGFPNLLSLKLFIVEFEYGKFGELLNQCHVLEIFNFFFTNYNGKVKLSEITKLTNLKNLDLSLCNLGNTEITSSSSIFEILGFLPKLQGLQLNFQNFKFTEFGDRKRSPTTFPCLKTLELSNIVFCNDIMFDFAFEIIRSFPNLQTLIIAANARFKDPPPAICSSKVDYNTMGSLQIRIVVFTNWKDSVNELCLIEYVLACFPFLKKVVIRPHPTLGSNEKLDFSIKLLELRRASPFAEIKLV